MWRRTQDLGAALAALDAALLTSAPTELILQKAKLLEFAGDAAGALAFLEARLRPDDAFLLAAAAQAGLAIDPARALAHAEQAARLAPNDPAVILTLCQAHLASGDAKAAAASAKQVRELAPADQQAIALLATAQRLLGDPVYRETADYDLVRTYRLDPPSPWPDLPAFLADLAAALLARHRLAGHPIGQSTRGGGEASLDPRFAEEPVIRAFFDAVRDPIAPPRRRDRAGRGAVPHRRGLVGAAAAGRLPRQPCAPARLDLLGLLRRSAGRRGGCRKSRRLAEVRRARAADVADARARAFRQAGTGPAGAVPLPHVARRRTVRRRRAAPDHRLRRRAGLSQAENLVQAALGSGPLPGPSVFARCMPSRKGFVVCLSPATNPNGASASTPRLT
ncbi:MAG: hypothetical protein WDM85_01185 [Caulobacteraceae bacterium]